MKRALLSAGALCLFATAAIAQTETVTCGDYSAMDNAKQMETVAELESLASQMDPENQLTADQIHEKLAAECQGQVDVLVIEVLKAE